MHVITKKAITHLYAQKTASDFFQTIQDYTQVSREFDKVKTLLFPHPQKPPAITEEDKECVKTQVSTLPDFRCQGIALGQAWASYLSGDTVASVLVGGMMTVLNGHFAMHTGDEVQWYFDFEKESFQSSAGLDNGSRNSADVNPRKSKDIYMDQRLYGGNSGIGKSSGLKQIDKIVRIKSYRMCRSPSNGTTASVMPQSDHYGDKSRVFAKCISGGRAFDAVDIMLMTQSS
jgi:hypothetical protein